MKQLLLVLTYLTTMSIHAQTPVTLPPIPVEALPMYSIQVTVDKTANLVFPYEIKSVDRGTESLLVQKVAGAGHILQVKAASGSMPETNLSVVTADMQLYSFLVRFDSFPKALNYRFKYVGHSLLNFSQPGIHQLNDAQIIQDAVQVEAYEPFINRVADSRDGTTLKLNGIFVHENVLYFSLQLKNETQLNYDIESLQFMIKDQRSGKRTARQEIIIPLLYSYGDTALVEANHDQWLVIAVPKFTIPDKKDCIIQLREGGGGRHLEIKISNKTLIRCRSLSN